MDLLDYLQSLTFLAILDAAVVVLVVPFVLSKKRDPTVAVAWCLVVLLVPLLGALLFWSFGYNYVHRRVTRKRTHRSAFGAEHPPAVPEANRGATVAEAEAPLPHPLARLALAVNAFPVSDNNLVTLYHDTARAEADLLAAVAAARHHVHLQFYIFRSDGTGRQLLDLLVAKARAGVEVRVLVDAVGTLMITGRFFRPLVAAGGAVREFLPVNLFRSWAQVNLRNHRKIAVIDGETGFTGGMNIGDEYQGRDSYFGHWRDTFVRVAGPAVAGLQRVFVEDWDFATGEALNEEPYFPDLPPRGRHAVQVVESGPDQETNSIREVYFAAILAATRRLWIATPYFVPDGGLLDALRLARLRGVDLRLLTISKGDHFLSYHASRYYFADLLAFGAKIYSYQPGMMHAKVVLVDDSWALVGSPNLDNRSLHLNFEIACILYSPDLVAELDAQFLRDAEASEALSAEAFARRSFVARLKENTARLFSPIL